MTEEIEEEKKSCPFPIRCCGNRLFLLEVDDATAFQCYRLGNGGVVMSNVFLSTAFITLAKRSVGCSDEDEICEGQVFGFKPSSLITIIATVSGLLSASLLPVIGAIVDFTKHRRIMGKILAVLIISIQAIQIGTVERTWFVMAILQALNGFFYQASAVVAYAYLPEIKRAVGDATMTKYSSQFQMCMFSNQSLYLVVVIAVSIVFKFDNVVTAHFGQGFDVALSGFFYLLAFYFFTQKEPRRNLPQGSTLVTAGFKQVYTTVKGIYKYYPSTMGWFFLAVTFGESALNSYTTVGVTFMAEIGLTATETGIVYLVVLISSLPGSLFAMFVSKRTTPTISIRLCTIVFIIANFIGFRALAIPGQKQYVYLVGASWGFLLGWYYPTEVLIYSSLMPSGQEAELAGFALFCSQILGWLPPLMFTVLNEKPNVHISWGGIQLNIYFFISLCCYWFIPQWDKAMATTRGENKIVKDAVDKEKRSEDDAQREDKFVNNITVDVEVP